MEIRIYNSLGQMIRKVDEGGQPAGTYRFNWDGRNDRGLQVLSGVYYCQLQAGDLMKVRKMILVR